MQKFLNIENTAIPTTGIATTDTAVIVDWLKKRRFSEYPSPSNIIKKTDGKLNAMSAIYAVRNPPFFNPIEKTI